MTIKLILSNNYNILADKLSSNLHENSNPFQKQSIIVQTEGMQKWLSLKISDNNSVFGNFDFIGVNNFFRRLYYILLDFEDDLCSNRNTENKGIGSSLFNSRGNGLYRKESLKWIIYNILKENVTSDNALKDIKEYLKETDSAKGSKIDYHKMFQLSNRLADLYDQYLIHRWEVIEKWSKDEFYYTSKESSDDLLKLEKWQKKIWLYIKEILGNIEPDKIEIRRFILNKLNSNINNQKLIDRIKNIIGSKIPLFGFSIIPEYYLQILNVLSSFIKIPFYLMSPSDGYWYDIKKQKEIDKTELNSLLKNGIDPELLHLSIGNPILAEMGTTGKDFFNLLLNLEDDIDLQNEENEYVNYESDNQTILETIKQDILELKKINKEEDKRVFSYKTDNSIKIVSCSSKLREVEILKDYILDIFDNNKNNNKKISATDILVLAPDIEDYSSFIDLLFSNTIQSKYNGNYKIPYSISSKSFSASNISASVLIEILKISSGKVLSSEIISIIDTIPVKNKFLLTDEDISTIKKWVDQTGIRWGIDSNHREKVDNISYEENSWSKGLTQLLAGYSMFEEKGMSFLNIIPSNFINSGNSELLGKFIEITNIIFSIVNQNSKNNKKTISNWADYINKLCDNLFSDGYTDESYSGVDELRNNINNFDRIFSIPEELNEKNIAIEKIKNSEIEFSIISKEIINSLTINQNKDERFMHRGITFSNLVPMRSIPFKVVCILGMNQDKFPRINKNSDIDLISLDPKIGDRTIRDNDLYLFLDTLLSAQETLYISYIGKSIVDNTEKLPSAPVSSLIDYIENSFKIVDEKKKIVDELVVEHPLQPFSTRYQMKNEEKLETYNDSYSIKNTWKNKNLTDNNLIKGLPKINFNTIVNSNSNYEKLTNKDLINFFKNPSKFYYTNKFLLSSQFSDIDEPLKDRENYEKDNLVEYHITKTLVETLVKNDDMNWIKKKIKSEGNLPYGKNSNLYLDILETKSIKLVEKLKEYGFNQLNSKIVFEVILDSSTISVSIDNYFKESSRVIFWHTTKLKAKHKIEALITHLLVNTYFENTETIYVSETDKDNYFSLKKMTKEFAEESLSKILKLYNKGVQSPLIFFPNSSLKYTIEKNKKGDSEKAFNTNAMNELYYNNFNYTPEIASSEYFNHFFPNSDNFKINYKDEFEYNSSVVFDIFQDLMKE